MKNSIVILLLLHVAFLGFSQGLSFEVRGAYRSPILKEKLIGAKTMTDLNPGYPSSWISGYISAEIVTTCNGTKRKAISANDTLSNEQMSILKMADLGTDIMVEVKYNPKNFSDTTNINKVNFSFTIIPETEAEYPGGYELLKQYLKENAIDKIANPIAQKIEQATLKFTIGEEGQIIDAQISMSSGDEETDNLLLQAINKMPKWKPAENAAGIKVKQTFELRAGNAVGC